MLSETLADGLGQYEIGTKIRVLRQAKKLGLVQLGGHTGLSPAMLSKIERGQLIPTLPTLLRIAMVFGVGLDHFFAEAPDRPKVAVVRKAERLRLPDRQRNDMPSYFFESLDFPVTDRKMQAYYAEFPASSNESQPHQHDGAELVYVIKGRLALSIAGSDFVLDEGDAIYFDSGAPHSYRCDEPDSCSAIVVTVP
ncbi:cupin domain-containing protein [Microvirga sp. ACRRW]|uniref:helix-turn-helix domain-containing protein n=1 Tax=Microvirga sp. ACRRW TaxID=2918205 RepID=UPI001EF74F7B|nr:cupin domain-containing protein [Microvirga sp. ACRRW]MCG7391805.1 cupin domain-containing protein [Microvirga sp. ACRRW]